jgi:hypothetical protein
VVVEPPAEVRASTLVDVRAHAAHHVPPALIARVLDSDDLGTERSQDLGGAGTGKLTREVADTNVLQRAHVQRLTLRRRR